MAAARASADPRDRLVAELLARTGMRAGELAGLDAGAVVQIGAGHWPRIPLGKLRNDRYVPLHPELTELLAAWTAANLEHIRRHKRLVAGHRGPLDRYLTLPTRWLSGSHEHALTESFTAFIGHPAYNTGTLPADLHRFAFPLGASDGEDLFGEPAP